MLSFGNQIKSHYLPKCTSNLVENLQYIISYLKNQQALSNIFINNFSLDGSIIIIYIEKRLPNVTFLSPFSVISSYVFDLKEFTYLYSQQLQGSSTPEYMPDKLSPSTASEGGCICPLRTSCHYSVQFQLDNSAPLDKLTQQWDVLGKRYQGTD